MEKKIRFRNHISVILEQLGAAFGILLVLFITNIDDLLDYIEGGTAEELSTTAFIGGMILFTVLVCSLLYQWIVWAKTYISICDNSIVIERNTINKKKNTIGIKNISNVNTEQNLLEMLLGTCKVKLDTNTMSTSDKTDVKIVLKKADAEQFRFYMMKLLQGENAEREEKTEEEENAWSIQTDFADIFIHGLFSINLLSIFVVLGCLVAVVGMVTQVVGSVKAGESIGQMLVSFLMLIIVLGSAIWDIMKGFIRYYDFKIKRNDEKLYIRYGVLKKVNYTIPIETISALKIKQTFFARLTGRFMAEIVNIGMGDDASETEAFFLPYCKKGKMEERIRLLLPEFSEALQMETKRQPKRVWIAWIWPIFLFAVFLVTGTITSIVYSPEFQTEILWGVSAFCVLTMFFLAAHYLTAGVSVGDDYMAIANGYFGRVFCYISYRDIQYLEFSQNIFANCVKLQKGGVHLLAASANREQTIPYISMEEGEKIKEKILIR